MKLINFFRETYHKNTCPAFQNLNNPSNDLSDTSHSMLGPRRCLADYEEVIGKNKTSDLGKGSYGMVRLVKEKKTGMLFAMKTVSILPRSLFLFKI